MNFNSLCHVKGVETRDWERFCCLFLGLLETMMMEQKMQFAPGPVKDSASYFLWINPAKTTWIIMELYSTENQYYPIIERNLSWRYIRSKNRMLKHFIRDLALFHASITFTLLLGVELVVKNSPSQVDPPWKILIFIGAT